MFYISKGEVATIVGIIIVVILSVSIRLHISYSDIVKESISKIEEYTSSSKFITDNKTALDTILEEMISLDLDKPKDTLEYLELKDFLKTNKYELIRVEDKISSSLYLIKKYSQSKGSFLTKPKLTPRQEITVNKANILLEDIDKLLLRIESYMYLNNIEKYKEELK